MATKRYQDDLYQAVNGEWEETAVIPDDKPATGGFQDLADEVEKQLLADFAAVADGSKQAPSAEFGEAVKLYQLAKDFEQRNQLGITPAIERLTWFKTLTFDTFNAHLGDIDRDLLPLPIAIDVEPDMKDTSKNSLMLTGPSTILPDTTYYAEDNQQGPQLIALWRQMAEKVLAQSDLSDAEQSAYLDDTLAFDRLIAARIKSSEEWADYPKAYNPQSFEQVAKALAPFDFEAYTTALFNHNPETIIVGDPRFLEEFSGLFNEANFTLYQRWAYVTDLLSNTGYLSDGLRITGGEFGRALSGSPEAPSQIKHAYRLANSFFSEPIGIYYGRTYFGEAAKADVTALVERMIKTYQSRLQNSTWLSQSTKDQAVVKLDKMVLKMGYPDKAREIYQQLHVDSDRDLLSNVIQLAQIRHQDHLSKLTQPVDRTTWNMPGHLVNASYDPSRNDITFPAAILQAPFYSLEQSDSQNLGGIGAVIAHEISHGFDNNGAQFDEFGNLHDWWQPEDYKQFNQLTQAMIEEFDGLETAAGKVNGKLVVSENIADAGGLAAALETAMQEKDVDLKAFFINWARVWRQKARIEYQQLLLSIDVHAPAVLRANVQPQNLDEWYTTFDVQPGDGMYLAPEKRIHIW
ncbi:M13 family metallopeptidase [Lacticaseibacillus saniviri]|uniref:Endopeptidase O n=1 Tax=Lacticaseibacillus saniviri JCM 17471 = DSM 24301 TaxID=1293598 RepID=A0A0R2N1G3_9LACO|nr:M13-type metalloendopeptidase [Lacticaseibacillus saniviri]KRO18224.1 endopeptidase O [Lacticaseibacillus saniviri JCM 17471 = DSM 24301]MCG4282731.1 M13 family peptidase [Lacticaseibacillus saniviri]